MAYIMFLVPGGKPVSRNSSCSNAFCAESAFVPQALVVSRLINVEHMQLTHTTEAGIQFSFLDP